jgi:glycosyltransferase involved in cell wall biosynthesis
MNNRTLVTILTWNRLKVTKNTIKTLFHHNGRDIDLLFIDNGSTDGTPDYLESKGYEVLRNVSNQGIFNASTSTWLRGAQRGYDFILNLQNDFPCTSPIRFGLLEKYLDDNHDIGFIRLNKKKDKKQNLVTKEPIKYEKPEKISNFTLEKCNYHFGFNPALIKASIIDSIVSTAIARNKKRERGLMEGFAKLGMKCAKLRPEVFDTLKQDHRIEGWKH